MELSDKLEFSDIPWRGAECATVVDWSKIPLLEVRETNPERIYIGKNIAGGSTIRAGTYLIGCKVGDRAVIKSDVQVIKGVVAGDYVLFGAKGKFNGTCKFGKETAISSGTQMHGFAEFGDRARIGEHFRGTGTYRFGKDVKIGGWSYLHSAMFTGKAKVDRGVEFESGVFEGSVHVRDCSLFKQRAEFRGPALIEEGARFLGLTSFSGRARVKSAIFHSEPKFDESQMEFDGPSICIQKEALDGRFHVRLYNPTSSSEKFDLDRDYEK